MARRILLLQMVLKQAQYTVCCSLLQSVVVYIAKYVAKRFLLVLIVLQQVQDRYIYRYVYDLMM